MKIRTLKIPPQYQEVEYIQSDGSAYIDTGYVPSYIDGFEIFIKFQPESTGYRYCLLSQN